MLSEPALASKPAIRLEDACASGSAAMYAALNFLEAGQGKVALVVGAEKMTAKPTAEAGDILLGASYRKEEAEVEGGFAGIFARIAQNYFQRYGDRSEELARIAAKNHKNGVHNPYAQMRKDLGFEFCSTMSEKNPYVAHPLRRSDCSLVSDGAAALVLGRRMRRAMRRARSVSAPPRRRTIFCRSPGAIRRRFEGAAAPGRGRWRRRRSNLADLSLVETHDCFTIAELMEYEAMGLTPAGQGAYRGAGRLDGEDGRLPVNPSGGLKAKGHPIGATGVSMHVMAAMQLTGQAGGMQIPNAESRGRCSTWAAPRWRTSARSWSARARVRPEKCEAVFRKDARQNKNLEPAFDSIKSGL